VLERAELAADEVRRSLGLTGPASPFDVAARLGLVVEEDKAFRPRGFTCPTDGDRVIWLRSGDRTTRTCYALAHEIGHWHVYDQNREDLLERLCDRFAASLLMPRAEFVASSRDAGFDLWKLQKVWRFSSLEAIARRMGEAVPEVISAAWLETATRWRAPKAPSDPVAALEREALGFAYSKSRGRAEARSEHGAAWVWRTSATGMRRALSVCVSA